jgi:hypothetical protein
MSVWSYWNLIMIIQEREFIEMPMNIFMINNTKNQKTKTLLYEKPNVINK